MEQPNLEKIESGASDDPETMFQDAAIDTVVGQVWDKYDKDGCGNLNLAEAKTFVTEALGFEGEMKDRDNAFGEVFKHLDVNGDGHI